MKVDFIEDSVQEMSNEIKGKVIEKVSLENRYEDFLVIDFSDGKKLKIRYDYIYEWEIV